MFIKALALAPIDDTGDTICFVHQGLRRKGLTIQHVSIPDWPNTVKDINDAVKLWGKLPTLLTIMQSRETSKIKIELRKRQLEKKINRPREIDA